MYGHVITKFSRMGSLPHFFTHGAPLGALHARAPLKTGSFSLEKDKPQMIKISGFIGASLF